MESQDFSYDLAGRTLTFGTGELALQASGAVVVGLGDTRILATATMSSKGREGATFFPLMCEYSEKFYAAGKIKGSRFIKREGRPSDSAILNSRLIDRPIRPMFPKGMANEVQIICTILSADMEVSPAALAITAASAALSISGMPFDGPIAGVLVGLKADEQGVDQLILNPTYDEVKEGRLNLIVAGTKHAITMVEAGASEVDEETMVKALDFAHQHIKKICILQEEFAAQHKKEDLPYDVVKPSEEVETAIAGFVTNEMLDTIKGVGKDAVNKTKKALVEKMTEHFVSQIEDETFSEGELKEVLMKHVEKNMRRNILEKEVRIDGRAIDEIRPIMCKTGLLPRTHGSALFQRGETQALTVTTLGSPGDAMIVDTMDEDVTKRYMHFYNFPPYAVGEARMMRGPGRREIGHGALAERALLPVLPDNESFPYTMHVVSEITTCNGSSSMASVCGSSMSLMSAGVPLKRHVSAIAMGLMTDGEGNHKILTDIQGLEDFGGDMDFKVAGTTEGITALQMDIKLKGLSLDLLREALGRAKTARMQIMDKMVETVPETGKMSKYAPLIIAMQIDPDKIRDVIGKGGSTIQGITADYGVQIDIEDSGLVMITAPDQESGDKARAIVEKITYVPKAGDIFEGEVVRIMDFGAFVSITPGKDGLVHISQLSNERVNKVEDVVKLGDKIKVKLMEIDSQGRYNLSRKVLLSGPDSKLKNADESKSPEGASGSAA